MQIYARKCWHALDKRLNNNLMSPQDLSAHISAASSCLCQSLSLSCSKLRTQMHYKESVIYTSLQQHRRLHCLWHFPPHGEILLWHPKQLCRTAHKSWQIKKGIIRKVQALIKKVDKMNYILKVHIGNVFAKYESSFSYWLSDCHPDRRVEWLWSCYELWLKSKFKLKFKFKSKCCHFLGNNVTGPSWQMFILF